jgi:hypothetical protein
MPLSDNGKNNALDNIGITHLSLHTGIPSQAGSNEVSGGSPAYARKAVTFNSASGGTKDKNATDPVFDVPSSTDVFYVGYWDALTAGNFLGYGPLNGGTVRGFGTAANTGDVITSYAHGLSDDDRVVLYAVNGGSLPTGYSATTIYYVVNSATDTFQVSTTQGGSVVTISADGELAFQKVTPQNFSVQGTVTIDTVTLSLNGVDW